MSPSPPKLELGLELYDDDVGGLDDEEEVVVFSGVDGIWDSQLWSKGGTYAIITDGSIGVERKWVSVVDVTESPHEVGGRRGCPKVAAVCAGAQLSYSLGCDSAYVA